MKLVQIVIASVFSVIAGIIIYKTKSRPDLQMIALGTSAFILGSFILVLADDWKGGKSRKFLKAIFVPIIFAFGALLTTHGWNLRDNYFSDRARLVAMAAELNLNQIRIDLLSLYHGEYEVTNNPEKMTALPLLSTYQINQVLSFSDIQQNDANFADTVFEYVFAADLLNSKLVQIDRVCSSHIVSREMAKGIIESAFGEESIFNVFRDLHNKLAGHLVANYGWCYEEARIKIRKPMVDNIYHAIAKRYMQLNSFEHQKKMNQLRDILQKQGKLIPIPHEDSNSQTVLDPNS